VSNLTGRAEELEREAADLRRENGWLKEIVMLKGSRYAATQGQASSSQTAALGTAVVPGTDEHEESEGSESDTSSDEEEKALGKNKGKGRARSKKRS